MSTSTVCSLRALIRKVVNGSGQGPYVVAYPFSKDEAERFGLAMNTSITFYRSILPPDRQLMYGQVVLLSQISQHEKGWRAGIAELVEAQAPQAKAGENR